MPIWLSAIARFTATVVFPTPPLPAPTAMMFLTPGTGALPVSRFAVERTCAVISICDVGDAGQRGHRLPRLLAHLVLDRTGRRRQLDREGHAPPVDAEILDELQRDDVAVEIGISDGAERVEYGRFGNVGHGYT